MVDYHMPHFRSGEVEAGVQLTVDYKPPPMPVPMVIMIEFIALSLPTAGFTLPRRWRRFLCKPFYPGQG